MPLFSIPLSGLTASSTALSAISNNLANLNTVGYKQTTVEFRDLLYQNFGSNGSGNPIQVGAGVSVGAVPADFTAGSVNPTGVATDVAIMGEGFFVLQKAGVTSYTRAGNFSVDKNGFLVSVDGQQVLGYPTVAGVVSTGQGLTALQLGTGSISPPNPTSSVALSTNLDAGAAVADSFSTPVTIFDSLGASHVLTFAFSKTASNAWSYSITIPAADTTASSNVLSSGKLTFNGNGVLTSVNGSLTGPTDVTGIAITGLTDGASDMKFDWKLLNGSTPTLTQLAAPSNTSSTQQDGFGSGSLTGFNINADGTLQGTFTNGKTAVLGQLVTANFPNVQGLLRQGQNDFGATLASGQAVVGAPNTGGRGGLAGGALELSNVDIAKEFTQLIVAQRAFQANARVITTFDQITQDTIALKQ